MKLISWNVNGLRAVLKKGLLDFIADEDADVICLQETKCCEADIEHQWSGYTAYWNAAKKKGYSGVAVLSRREPLEVTRGIACTEHDCEGRVLTVEYPEFFLVNVYVPNSKRELTRLEYRQRWDRDFLAHLRRLEQKKPVIFCGDLNVAHQEIDLARPKQNTKTHGFTPEERAGFSALLEAGFIDSFRHFEPGGGHYTWWSQMMGARAKDIGWRIDYFLCSGALKERLKAARIYKQVMGSDHCPVGLELHPPTTKVGKSIRTAAAVGLMPQRGTKRQTANPKPSESGPRSRAR